MSDRVLLITGASSGIGAATARAAAEAGWRLVLAARSEARLEELVHELGGPDRALAVRCDVTSWPDQQAMAEAALRRFGRIDAAFANAGIGGSPGGFTGADPEHWRAMILTNVWGVALTARAALPHLVDSTGHLVLMGSVAGRVTIDGSLYSATKWAVTGMAQAIRAEVHRTGVRVTVIQPGKVVTPFFEGDPPPDCLETDDVVGAVRYAVSQPTSVDVNEIVLRSIDQHR